MHLTGQLTELSKRADRNKRWHLLLIESVLSCHFQLHLPLYRLFSFIPSVTTMLQAALVTQSLLISSIQFLTLLPFLHLHLWIFLSYTLHHTLVPALCLLQALMLFPGSCDSVITSDLGEGSGGVLQHREMLSGGSACESRPI